MGQKRGICNFCGTGCGHLFQVIEGKARGVQLLPGHPLSQGRLGVRGWHVSELPQISVLKELKLKGVKEENIYSTQ